MKLNQKSKNQISKLSEGITLIALVITIIVLLILAGVSIATLTGDNGILTKVQTAKTETEKASKEEQLKLAELNAAMNTEKYNYVTGEKDKSGKTITVPIPAGFAPTGIEGENTVKDGFVITDEKGNEFVWIPCDINEDTSKENTSDGKINYNAKRSEDWKTYQSFYNEGTWGDGQPNKEEIQNSIKNNKGFYVARYEAGIPENATKFYANSDGASYKDAKEKNIANLEYKPVSKQGMQAWNFITQDNAKKVAENMISNSGVQSYLIDSHAWNTTCRVIQKYDNNKSLVDSHTWGNYFNSTIKYENLDTLYAVHIFSSDWEPAKTYNKGRVKGAPKSEGDNKYVLELSTGASDDLKAYNIYDLAGNMWEWTTENGNISSSEESDISIIPDVDKLDIDNAKNAVFRGGSFYSDGDVHPAVSSYGNFMIGIHCPPHVGFRVVLYLEP